MTARRRRARDELSEAPLVHPSAEVVGGALGRYTEVAERCVLQRDHARRLFLHHAGRQAWAARIGKFANIAAHARINATNHPIWRATLHHFTYRADDYWPDAERDESFFDWRRENAVVDRPRRLDRPRRDAHARRQGRQRRRDRRGRCGHARRRALHDRRRRSRAVRSSRRFPARSASGWMRSPGGTGATSVCAPRSTTFARCRAEAFLEKYGA